MNRQRSRDRVRISDENAPVLEALGDNTTLVPVFNSQAEAVAFAATLGYHFDKFEPVEGQKLKAILFQQIDNATELGSYLDAVFALARAEDIDVLGPQEGEVSPDMDRVLIFEGYVNGGLSYLRKLGFDPAQPIDAVLSLARTLDPKNSDLLSRS
ncbi:MAG: hypothetical protein F4124_12860 [Acidimicrobiia bacterium]|nr:hypothetical protein [Acidimicrobiia bacterium]MYB74740.1 hypothetical protein [Acidimicrobiia bacterium]MYI00309.1 hypothetical protein [Acidimicrobiia bacterium]